MPIPSTLAIWLVAAGLAWPLLLGGGRGGLAALAAWDVGVLLLVLLDRWRAPAVSAFQAERRLRTPLTAFCSNPVSLRLRCDAPRPLRIALADAPPPGFDSDRHRQQLTVPAGRGEAGEASIDYLVTPRASGRHAFGDLHLRVLGALGLAWRPLRLPLARAVMVLPSLGGGATSTSASAPALAQAPEVGRAVRPFRGEGREFAALRHYLVGDDLRAIDWKATARRGWPVVREWQPERNQTVWVLIDCGRHLGARLADGRTRLDRAVEAALALARAASGRGDRCGAILFGAEVERVVPPEARASRLGPLAEALSLARARPVEADCGAAFDELLRRQRRRALVVVFTDLGDPDTSALLLARAELLRRRHVVAVATLSDGDLVELATARPSTGAAARARAAAERIVEEREVAARRLAAAGVAVVTAPASGLAAAVVLRYAAVKARGAL